jgi:SAM-dependent methyltransferase
MEKRWQRAQESERAYWEESFRDEPAFRRMCLSFYPVYKEILGRNNIDTSDMKVLDVGSGPYGLVSVIAGARKYALDPLMEYFQKKVPAGFYEENNIIPVTGVGENLKLKDKCMDLVCCINTLDHADCHLCIMEQANRVLKEGGYLLLSVNHYDWPIVLLRRFLETIGFGDTCHPKTFHLSDIAKLMRRYNFRIIDQKIGSVGESQARIAEAGGQIEISLKERLSRAVKRRGLWYAFKQALAAPLHAVFNRLFTTFPDSIFLCQKTKETKETKKTKDI